MLRQSLVATLAISLSMLSLQAVSAQGAIYQSGSYSQGRMSASHLQGGQQLRGHQFHQSQLPSGQWQYSGSQGFPYQESQWSEWKPVQPSGSFRSNPFDNHTGPWLPLGDCNLAPLQGTQTQWFYSENGGPWLPMDPKSSRRGVSPSDSPRNPFEPRPQGGRQARNPFESPRDDAGSGRDDMPPRGTRGASNPFGSTRDDNRNPFREDQDRPTRGSRNPFGG